MVRRMLHDQVFWLGASLAFLPAVVMLPAVLYAGVALANSFWHLFFGRDAPESIAVAAGFAYGIAFGPVLQCWLIGLLAHLAADWGLRRLFVWLSESGWPTRAVAWIGLEIAYLLSSVWICLGIVVYAVAAALSWLVHRPVP